MRVFFTVLLFTIFTAFAGSFEAKGRPVSVSVQVHKEKAVPRTGLRIGFLEMVEDSRCPTDTNCVWAGNAKVRIQVSNGRNSPKTFELNTLSAPQIVTYNGYEIKFVGLTPQPRSNIRIDRNGYVATLEVRKLSR